LGFFDIFERTGNHRETAHTTQGTLLNYNPHISHMTRMPQHLLVTRSNRSPPPHLTSFMSCKWL